MPGFASNMALSSRWLGVFSATVAMTWSVHMLGALGPIPPLPLALELSVYSSALLAAASAVYVLNLRARAALLGAWATGLSVAATVEVALVAAADWLDRPAGPQSDVWPRGDALLMLLALSSYLVLESVYRDRRAGAFVLPILACAALLHAWLVGAVIKLSADAFLGLLWSWSVAVFAAVGYGLLAIGGWLALQTLVTRLPRAQHSFPRMVGANVSGVLVLGAAATCWEAWAQHLPRDALFLNPIEPWVLGVLLAYAGHLLLLWLLRPTARHTAAWAVVLFGASLAVLIGTMARSWTPSA